MADSQLSETASTFPGIQVLLFHPRLQQRHCSPLSCQAQLWCEKPVTAAMVLALQEWRHWLERADRPPLSLNVQASKIPPGSMCAFIGLLQLRPHHHYQNHETILSSFCVVRGSTSPHLRMGRSNLTKLIKPPNHLLVPDSTRSPGWTFRCFYPQKVTPPFESCTCYPSPKVMSNFIYISPICNKFYLMILNM